MKTAGATDVAGTTLLVLSVGNPPRMPTQNPNWFWKQSVWSTACLSAEADISALGYAGSAFMYMPAVCSFF